MAGYGAKDMDSEGDPRVHAVMNFIFSFLFSGLVVQGLDFVGVAEFSWTNVGLATAFLFVITWVVVLRR